MPFLMIVGSECGDGGTTTDPKMAAEIAPKAPVEISLAPMQKGRVYHCPQNANC